MQEEPICDGCLMAFRENRVVGPEPDIPGKHYGRQGPLGQNSSARPHAVMVPRKNCKIFETRARSA